MNKRAGIICSGHDAQVRAAACVAPSRRVVAAKKIGAAAADRPRAPWVCVSKICVALNTDLRPNAPTKLHVIEQAVRASSKHKDTAHPVAGGFRVAIRHLEAVNEAVAAGLTKDGRLRSARDQNSRWIARLAVYKDLSGAVDLRHRELLRVASIGDIDRDAELVHVVEADLIAGLLDRLVWTMAAANRRSLPIESVAARAAVDVIGSRRHQINRRSRLPLGPDHLKVRAIITVSQQRVRRDVAQIKRSLVGRADPIGTGARLLTLRVEGPVFEIGDLTINTMPLISAAGAGAIVITS